MSDFLDMKRNVLMESWGGKVIDLKGSEKQNVVGERDFFNRRWT